MIWIRHDGLIIPDNRTPIFIADVSYDPNADEPYVYEPKGSRLVSSLREFYDYFQPKGSDGAICVENLFRETFCSSVWVIDAEDCVAALYDEITNDTEVGKLIAYNLPEYAQLRQNVEWLFAQRKEEARMDRVNKLGEELARQTDHIHTRVGFAAHLLPREPSFWERGIKKWPLSTQPIVDKSHINKLFQDLIDVTEVHFPEFQTPPKPKRKGKPRKHHGPQSKREWWNK